MEDTYPADLHPLDLAYCDACLWPPHHPKWEKLFAEVLSQAKRLTKSEDAAAEAVAVIVEKIEQFRPKTIRSFSRWVMSICRRSRLAGYRANRAIAYTAPEDDDDNGYLRDCSRLPARIRQIAEWLAQGYSLQEIASILRIKPSSVRKIIHRYVSQK